MCMRETKMTYEVSQNVNAQADRNAALFGGLDARTDYTLVFPIGTKMKTPDAQVSVETLSLGDLVTCPDGAVRRVCQIEQIQNAYDAADARTPGAISRPFSRFDGVRYVRGQDPKTAIRLVLGPQSILDRLAKLAVSRVAPGKPEFDTTAASEALQQDEPRADTPTIAPDPADVPIAEPAVEEAQPVKAEPAEEPLSKAVAPARKKKKYIIIRRGKPLPRADNTPHAPLPVVKPLQDAALPKDAEPLVFASVRRKAPKPTPLPQEIARLVQAPRYAGAL